MSTTSSPSTSTAIEAPSSSPLATSSASASATFEKRLSQCPCTALSTPTSCAAAGRVRAASSRLGISWCRCLAARAAESAWRTAGLIVCQFERTGIRPLLPPPSNSIAHQKNPAPTDLVLELGRKQDTAIRGWQATQAATRCDAASPVVVAAFGSEHALQPGAIDPGQLVAHHLALGLQIVE